MKEKLYHENEATDFSMATFSLRMCFVLNKNMKAACEVDLVHSEKFIFAQMYTFFCFMNDELIGDKVVFCRNTKSVQKNICDSFKSRNRRSK